jgi:hypothetical protein
MCSEAKFVGPTRDGRSPTDKAKPYCISRQEVLEAYRKVKSNKGAAGIVRVRSVGQGTALLQFQPGHREVCRPIVGSLGNSEIHDAARSPDTSLGMVAASH